MKLKALAFLLLALIISCASNETYDIVIRNAQIADGNGGRLYYGDLAINADTIAALGVINGKGNTEIDATDLVVAPGFINMLSWATESLIEDGRSMGDIKQGVTLEVFGEGWSMGPLSDSMKRMEVEAQGDIKYDIEWTSLREYLDYLVNKGISPNVASFVGATTLRIHEIGFENRAPFEIH